MTDISKHPPSPRLQFRWVKDKRSPNKWICYYEFVFPLLDIDVRRGQVGTRRTALKTDQVLRLGKTNREQYRTPCLRDEQVEYADLPYRDGAHAKWDAPHFGNPPIYVITPGGNYLPVKENDEQ